jgi:hypothetical protein
MDECGSVLADDAGPPMRCAGFPGHKGDHKRGFLRWSDDGTWYAVHSHPRSPGDQARPCPLCRDLVHDLQTHFETCVESIRPEEL